MPAAAPTTPRSLRSNLATAKLSPAMAAYFKKCQEKLGFVPNVLLAYAFDMAKLEAFVAMYNDLMLGASGLSKLEREMIAVAVSSQNRCYYCLIAHGAAVRHYSGDPVLGEQMVMNYRAAQAEQAAARDARLRGEAHRLSPGAWRKATASGCAASASRDRDIWDIAAVAGFFNMSNRVASATDMRPNRGLSRAGAIALGLLSAASAGPDIRNFCIVSVDAGIAVSSAAMTN